MKKSVLMLSTFLILCQIYSQNTEKGNLELKLFGFRNEKGQVLISLCASESSFPKHPAIKLMFPKGKIKNDTLNVLIQNVFYGKYAIAICDDENCDSTMNYNAIGFPKEGFGFSNNIKPSFKSPEFEKCSFNVDAKKNSLEIKMIYK